VNARMPSAVIVPAHNEESVLGATIARLLEGLDDDIQFLVVANGCTDRTVAVATAFGPRVRVLDLPEASKARALNAAEVELVESADRVYIDADVLISGSDVVRLLAATAEGAAAAEPTVVFDTSSSSFWVRSFYRVWTALHGARPGDIGGGVVAVSAIGRRRFASFPDVISDDGFVRAHFPDDDLVRVSGAISTVRAPSDVGSLIRIKTRSRVGSVELRRLFPELWDRKTAHSRNLREKASRLPVTVWPFVPIYAVIQVTARVRAELQLKRGVARWERDESSRQ
jgi:glycosyltransferase involved in cell wall biosynthesis